MIQTIQAPLLEKKVIAENTFEMTFGIPEKNFSFKPGQYVSVTLPGLENYSIMDKFHDFSIVSSPSEQSTVAIVFRGSGSVFKTTLLRLPMGSVVSIDGPKGVFTLPEATDVPVVLVAGGVGIAPFMSMMRYATEQKSTQKITFLYFNTKQESVAYKIELEELARKNPLISVRDFLGVPEKQHLVLEGESLEKLQYYVAGPPLMVSSVVQSLHNFGILSQYIRTEEFTGYEHE